MVHSYGMNIPDDLYEEAEDAREKGQPLCQWIFDAMWEKAEAENGAERPTPNSEPATADD